MDDYSTNGLLRETAGTGPTTHCMQQLFLPELPGCVTGWQRHKPNPNPPRTACSNCVLQNSPAVWQGDKDKSHFSQKHHSVTCQSVSQNHTGKTLSGLMLRSIYLGDEFQKARLLAWPDILADFPLYLPSLTFSPDFLRSDKLTG